MRTIYKTIKTVICAIAFIPMLLIGYIIAAFLVFKEGVVRGVNVVERTVMAVVQALRYIVCLPLNAVIYVLKAVIRGWGKVLTGCGLSQDKATLIVDEVAAATRYGREKKAEQAPTSASAGIRVATAEDMLRHMRNIATSKRSATSAKPRCSQCGKQGHNIRTCKKAPDKKSLWSW